MVSIIIPCRNEEKFIGKCLESLIKQDYPKDNFEILVVDGSSEDGTKGVAEKYTLQHSFIKILDNPQKFTPFALNIGIKNARGEVIVRMDSHADYEPDYISKCLKYLQEYNADNVGGIIKTLTKENTSQAKAIAYALSSFFGVGTSYFRLGSEKPRWVDTVFGGCYRREVFDKVGLFDERMVRGQDIEFNRRLKRSGGKILLAPDIVAYYYPQTTIANFWRHNFTDGFWTIYPLNFGIRIFSWRHLLPLFFTSGLLVLLCLSIFSDFFRDIFKIAILIYIVVGFYFAFKIIPQKKNLKVVSLIPVAFAARHVGYGLGSLLALINFAIKNYGRKKTKRN